MYKKARDLLPSPNTLSKRVEESLSRAKIEVATDLLAMKKSGGGLTLDFAKKQVDYIALTAHFINDEWKKENSVILFSPLPSGMQKSSVNVQNLVFEEMAQLGIEEQDWSKLFVTTDEGSNVCYLGGRNHQPCMCHLGSTLAKRTTLVYKNSTLSVLVQEKCADMDSALKCMEKLVMKLRQNDNLRTAAGIALKPPAETRWLSYYTMVNALLDNQVVLQTAIHEFAPTYAFAATLMELANDRRFKEYVDLLKPVADMVLELQVSSYLSAEKEPTSNKILEYLAEIWLWFNGKSQNNRTNSVHMNCLAKAAMECFNRKFGDLSKEDWLQNSTEKVNKRLILCSAFLDPFVHAQLRSMCHQVPGIKYEEIKRMVLEEAQWLSPEELTKVPVRNRPAKFVCIQPSQIEDEINSYTSLPVVEQNPLLFWKRNGKFFPRLAIIAKLHLAVQASSTPSERAFKELRCIVGNFTRNRMDPQKISALIHLRSSFLKEFV